MIYQVCNCDDVWSLKQWQLDKRTCLEQDFLFFDGVLEMSIIEENSTKRQKLILLILLKCCSIVYRQVTNK